MANKNTEKDVVAQMEEFLPVMDNWNLRIVSSFYCLLNVYVNWQYLIPVCQQGIGVSEKRDGRSDQVARRLVWILLWGQQELQAGGVLQVILPVHQQLQEGGGRQRQEEGAGEERGAQEAAAGERAGQAEIRILPRWEKYLQWRWKTFAVVWWEIKNLLKVGKVCNKIHPAGTAKDEEKEDEGDEVVMNNLMHDIKEGFIQRRLPDGGFKVGRAAISVYNVDISVWLFYCWVVINASRAGEWPGAWCPVFRTTDGPQTMTLSDRYWLDSN